MSEAASPASILRDRAEAMLKPTDELAFASDATSYPECVLLALARPAWCCVLAIPREKYGTGYEAAVRLGNLLGYPNQPRPPAIQRVTQAARSQSKEKRP